MPDGQCRKQGGQGRGQGGRGRCTGSYGNDPNNNQVMKKNMNQPIVKNKIACITSTGSGLDDQTDPKFGRCSYFAIIDLGSLSNKIIANANKGGSSGVGIVTAQLVVNEGVDVVVTGQVGPKAEQVLKAAGIQIITGVSGTVREAVDKNFNKKI